MNERTVERSDRIYLDSSIARCEPQQHCGLRSHCARYTASVPPIHGSMFDGTAEPSWSPSYCGNYIAASQCVKPAPQPPKPKRRHWDNSEW